MRAMLVMIATVVVGAAGCSNAAPNATVGSSFSAPATSLPSIAAATPTGALPTATATAAATPLGLISNTVAATSAPAGSIQVRLAGPPPHFEPAALSAKAGDIVFFLNNTSLGTHTLAIGPSRSHALAVSTAVVTGHAATFTVHGIPAGQYVIWCTIDGHADEGMVGTLAVR